MGLYRRALKYLLIMSLPLAIFISFESSKVIWLVFGKEYIRAIPIFKVLIWGSIFMFLSHLALTLMTCIDRQWTVIRIAATVLAINILLNITMVARYGMMGASWVSLLSEFCFTIFLVAALRRIGFRLERLRWLIRPLVACLIFAGVTYLTHSLPLIPQALLCGPALILSLFATRSFDDSEIAALTQVLAKFGLIRTRKAAQ